jgi:alpha-glucoside transport system substrate-binding protein
MVALVAILATFAWVQRQDARDAQTDLKGNQEAQRLVNLSASTLSSDPELALALAMYAVRSTVALGYAVPEAIDAVHWALQEMGVRYDVTDDTPTAARFGPDGVHGVWVLPVDELMDFAAKSTNRSLSSDECRLYFGNGGCPAELSVAGVEYRGGVEAYSSAVAFDQAEVVVAISSDAEQWLQNLDGVGEQYGVRISGKTSSTATVDVATTGLPGDILLVSDASQLPDLAAIHPLIDLRSFIDEATLLEDYGPHLVSLSRIGDDGVWPSTTGPIYAAFNSLSSKSLVWTKEPEFTDLGYTAPSDWESFMRLAQQMVADGRTPFCLGIESDGADGWPATDWVESVVLRTAGADFYDDWIDHRVPFDDPAVVNAIRTVGEMVVSPGFLDTTPAQAAIRPFGFALQDFFSKPGACLMTPFSSFLPEVVAGHEGGGFGIFEFPAFGRGHDDAVVGGGGIAVAVTDRPEVRRVMAALASPDIGTATVGLPWPVGLPANDRFDTAKIVNPEAREIVDGLQAAVRADELRFDASDAMPPEIGQNAFWAGMVRLFVEGTPENLDELSLDIARDIEAAWVELEHSADQSPPP